MTFSVQQGDVLDALPTLEADSFDAMLTDPPYHLTTGKRGGTGEASVNLSHPAGRARISTGFMGQRWDGGDIAFRADVWRECLRVLKPGALALVFGGTRTFHRLAVALEDAGFEMRDTLMWVYGSGFPKSHNLKGEWEGYGTALKPAWEPALLVRKPSPLTFAEGALEYGCGALNIAACRVPFAGEDDEAESKAKNQHERFGSGARDGQVYGEFSRPRDDYDAPGRWPANVIHDGSPEVVERFPRSDARPNTYGATPERSEAEGYGTRAWNKSGPVYADTGSAARFFYTAKASKSEREAGLKHLPEQLFAQSGGAQAALARGESSYQGPDASTGLNLVKKRRNPHPTVKPLALTRYLATLLLPPERVDGQPRRLLVPFAGVASEVIGGLQAGWDEVVGIEREAEYARVAEARIAHWTRGGQPGLNFAGAALEAEAKQ